MPAIWIDIETLPSEVKPDHAQIDAPSNYKDPVKIEAYQREKVDDVWRGQALDSLLGRVCSIAWAEGAAPVVCRGIWDRTEFQILSELNDVVQNILSDEGKVMWGGFNLKSFDLSWIWHRAVKYGLPALTDCISRERYPKNVIDVRDFWTGGDPYGKGKLKDIAKFFGLETIDDMDGMKVLDHFLAEEYDLIAKYNRRDVELTREIYWRMVPGNAPMLPKKKDTLASATV